MLLVAAAFAQYSGPGYTVVRADYGAGNSWRDVTGAVQSLARGTTLNFRVTNEALGGDPAPSQRKTLRLQLRDAGGQLRTLNVREKDIVNLVVASAPAAPTPPPPAWVGGLQITRAVYGAGSRVWDVTERVRAQVRDNQISLRVVNENMGGDPAEGAHKSLTVWYVDHGRTLQTTVAEGEFLNIAGPGYRAAPGLRPMPQMNGLRILRAEYGVGDRIFDVTARLNSQIQGDQLSLRVTNETMGGDPAEEHQKQLTVWYWYNGRTARTTVPEKTTLMLPGNVFDYVGALHVMRAQYGADYRFLDVTDRLNAGIQGDRLTLRITNDTMGGDPDPERRKALTVFYVYNGQPGQVLVNEKDTLDIPGNGNAPDWNWPTSGQLQILRAVYGIGDLGADVTARVASQVSGDRLNVMVSNDTMGVDPAPDRAKRLKVIYQWQGLRYETNVPEKGMLSLP